jgi:hypothetical protein
VHVARLAVAWEIDPRSVEEADAFVRENNGNPTPFGRLIVHLMTPGRLEALSAREVAALLDVKQRVSVFADR